MPQENITSEEDILPEEIVVLVLAEEYTDEGYCSHPCYLEKALLRAGYDINEDSYVSGFGSTLLKGSWYEPKERFDANILKEAFFNDQDITVTLIKEKQN